MTGTLRITVLGSGSSGGVPRVDGDWGQCDPTNPKNRRTRCSLAIERFSKTGDAPTTVVIDTSPDFRHQALVAELKRLDGVVWTHDHADQSHGIDDIRGFSLIQGHPITGYLDSVTEKTLTSRFYYIFYGNGGYPPICKPNSITSAQDFTIVGPGGNVTLTPMHVQHGAIKALGFRFHDIAYMPDVSDIDDATLEGLRGLKLWIVDALRYRPHPTHAHLEKTLSWIERVKPAQAVITNLHQDMDYETLRGVLPGSVQPAHDGLWFEFSI